MDELSIPANLMWLAVAIGVLVQFLKEFPPIKARKRFLPYLCIALAALGVHLSGAAENIGAVVQIGVAIGLMAAGGYDAIAGLVGGKPLKPDAMTAAGAAPLLLIAALAGALLLGGCCDPLIDAEHRLLVGRSEQVVGVLVERCRDGDEQACIDGLDEAHRTLRILSGRED